MRNSVASQPPLPQVYLAAAQQKASRRLAIFVRATNDPLTLVEPIRRQLAQLAPDEAAYDFRTMSQVLADDMASTTLLAKLFGAFGVAALALALAGLYGLLAWSVAQRTAEIGVRIALGARPNDILRQFVAEGSVLALTGIVIGVAAGLGLAQLIRSALYGVGAVDAFTFIIVPLLLAAVALSAIIVPSRRATRVQPLEALRYE